MTTIPPFFYIWRNVSSELFMQELMTLIALSLRKGSYIDLVVFKIQKNIPLF